MTTQAAAVRSWWTDLYEVDRRRVLRGHVDGQPLSEDLATGLAMAGVTVVPVDRSPVDGRPTGWFWPAVLAEFVVGISQEKAR